MYGRRVGVSRLRKAWGAAFGYLGAPIVTKQLITYSNDVKDLINSNSKNLDHRISLRSASHLTYGICALYKRELDILAFDSCNAMYCQYGLSPIPEETNSNSFGQEIETSGSKSDDEMQPTSISSVLSGCEDLEITSKQSDSARISPIMKRALDLTTVYPEDPSYEKRRKRSFDDEHQETQTTHIGYKTAISDPDLGKGVDLFKELASAKKGQIARSLQSLGTRNFNCVPQEDDNNLIIDKIARISTRRAYKGYRSESTAYPSTWTRSTEMSLDSIDTELEAVRRVLNLELEPFEATLPVYKERHFTPKRTSSPIISPGKIAKDEAKLGGSARKKRRKRRFKDDERHKTLPRSTKMPRTRFRCQVPIDDAIDLSKGEDFFKELASSKKGNIARNLQNLGLRNFTCTPQGNDFDLIQMSFDGYNSLNYSRNKVSNEEIRLVNNDVNVVSKEPEVESFATRVHWSSPWTNSSGVSFSNVKTSSKILESTKKNCIHLMAPKGVPLKIENIQVRMEVEEIDHHYIENLVTLEEPLRHNVDLNKLRYDWSPEGVLQKLERLWKGKKHLVSFDDLVRDGDLGDAPKLSIVRALNSLMELRIRRCVLFIGDYKSKIHEIIRGPNCQQPRSISI